MNNMGNDILINAYYMISLFENAKAEYDRKDNSMINIENETDDPRPNKIIISNLKLQKMMYFVEAYYMNKYDESSLYDSDWSAWDYGPVNIKLYNYFKKFGSVEISLSSEEKCLIADLPKENKECIKKIYEVFGNFNAFELVTLTHLSTSPWYEIKKSNKYNFEKLNDSIIKKEDSKKWFNDTFGFIIDLEQNNE